MKFSGGLPGAATFLYPGPGRCLLIELDDHSPRSESSFGNNVAFLIHVAVEHKPQMLTLLRGKQQRP